MTHSRRSFLKTLGVSASAAAASYLVVGPLSLVQSIEAAPIDADGFKALANVAFDRARQLGCSYADILIDGHQTGSVSHNSSGFFTTVIDGASFRIRVRALHSGAWGIAERPQLNKSEMPRLMTQAVGIAQTESRRTERSVVVGSAAFQDRRRILREGEDHLDALINEQMAGLRADERAISFRTEETYFASTNGTCSRTTRFSRV